MNTQDFKSWGEKAETLGNVRKINHLTGFSAEFIPERLGKIGNGSGRQMGDTLGAVDVTIKGNEIYVPVN